MGSAAPLLAQKTAAGERPNIVLIETENLGAWMCGVYGNTEIRTPGIDALARIGVRFLNSYVVTPANSPSWATLHTGRTPMQHGIEDFLTDNPVSSPPQGQQAPPSSFSGETMLSDLLSQAGYNCGFAGKWGVGNVSTPGHGFKFSYSMPAGPAKYMNPVMLNNGRPVEEKGYLLEKITGAATSFLGQQKPGQPFFLNVSYPNPEQPVEGHPQQYHDLYANAGFDKLGWLPAAPNALRNKELLEDMVPNIRRYAAGISALDAQLPALSEELRERQIWSDTLIVFTSQTGHLMGRHGLWGAGLASDPVNMYDEVVRVPLIMSWPGKTPIEGSRPEMVSHYDLLPTLCEAAGITPPANNLCGASYLLQAMGQPLPKDAPEWAGTVFGAYRDVRMARVNRFKVITRNGGNGPNEFYSMRRDEREMRNEYDNRMFITVRDRLSAAADQWAETYSG